MILADPISSAQFGFLKERSTTVDIGTNTEWITLLHTSIEQTGSEMLKTSAVSAWFAGHINFCQF